MCPLFDMEEAHFGALVGKLLPRLLLTRFVDIGLAFSGVA